MAKIFEFLRRVAVSNENNNKKNKTRELGGNSESGNGICITSELGFFSATEI